MRRRVVHSVLGGAARYLGAGSRVWRRKGCRDPELGRLMRLATMSGAERDGLAGHESDSLLALASVVINNPTVGGSLPS